MQACASVLHEGQCQFPYLCAHALLQVQRAANRNKCACVLIMRVQSALALLLPQTKGRIVAGDDVTLARR